MKKIDSTEFSHVLKDVRASYRLLALYQRRLLDLVQYIENNLGLTFNSGWPKFSKPALSGSNVKLNKWSWDWLTLYYYDFYFGTDGIELNDGNVYHFRIIHLADSGYFDVAESENGLNINEWEIDKFKSVEDSCSKLFFVLSRKDGLSIVDIMKANIFNDTFNFNEENKYLVGVYSMERFINKSTTDEVIQEFKDLSKQYLQIDLLKK